MSVKISCLFIFVLKIVLFFLKKKKTKNLWDIEYFMEKLNVLYILKKRLHCVGNIILAKQTVAFRNLNMLEHEKIFLIIWKREKMFKIGWCNNLNVFDTECPEKSKLISLFCTLCKRVVIGQPIACHVLSKYFSQKFLNS